jgi:hypothetical protein
MLEVKIMREQQIAERAERDAEVDRRRRDLHERMVKRRAAMTPEQQKEHDAEVERILKESAERIRALRNESRKKQ